MHLAHHVDPESLIKRLQDTRLAEPGETALSAHGAGEHLNPYTSRYTSQVDIPKFKIPEDGAEADTVLAMLKDELDLDGRPNLNLASFVNTYMEPNAQQLMVENLAKNLADADEYPAMLSMHDRCVSILAHLWGVQKNEKAVGSATTGSSEAIHLGGLAMKRRWQERRRAEGKDALRPNIIMGSNAQVALEKFARYFDVEARILPVSAASDYRLDPDLVRGNVDENTIGVFVILGSTYTGHYEPVEQISNILDDYQAETGIDIPIHVDAASGGFVAPFTYAGVGGPKWNFELPRVKSINASGHKYGLVYAGVGWVVWRDESYLPKHLIFELHYLGGTEYSFTLNFSRPGAQVIVQYYNLIHLGFRGYREVMENCLANARLLSKSLEATGWYTCLSAIHRPAPGKKPLQEQRQSQSQSSPAARVESAASAVASATSGSDGEGEETKVAETSADYVAGLPVVSFRLSDEFRARYPHVQQETVSLLMRARQWIIPNYALPPAEQHTEILRIVIRENMSFDLLDRLVTDICDVTQKLMDNDEVDLSVLQKQRRVVPLKKQDGAPRGKEKEKEEEEGSAGESARTAASAASAMGQEVKRMEEGIHRSVC